MAQIGEQEGVFERAESNIIANLLQFEQVEAKDIMTPRTVVVASDQTTTIDDYHAANPDERFSRIPIYQDSKDHVTGYVLKDELLAELVDNDGSKPLSDLRREILIVSESFPLPELFSRFVGKREHIALVVDEFGGMSGIVTMEDVIETLLGIEIVDELDRAADMQVLARRCWERRAKRLGLIVEQAPEAGPGD